jgi:phosphate transport system protein
MRAPDDKQVHGEVRELERRVIAMGNMVESLFADSVMALIESSPGMVPGMRAEDCRAHEQWLEVDKLCIELLTAGQLEADQIRFVWAAARIATDLKRTADESLRIGEALRSCVPEYPSMSKPLASVPRLAELTQSMLGDALDAFVNRDAVQAGALHLVFRELASQTAQTVKAITQGLTTSEIAAPLGAACLGVAQRLQRIGDEVLDISNQVSHLHRHTQ